MRKLFLFLVLILFTSTAQSVEQVNLQTNYVVDPRTASTFTVDSLILNWKEKRIVIHLGNGNVQKMVEYVDLPGNPVATNLMVALNKANLTNNSLHKRILTQLISDGHIDGTITGSVD